MWKEPNVSSRRWGENDTAPNLAPRMIQSTQEIKRMLFDQTNVHIFKEVLFFKLHTTEKQTINSTYLMSVGCGRLAEGKKHKADPLVQHVHLVDVLDFLAV